MTRAEEQLFLTWCGSRSERGRSLQQASSRFLAEIPEQLVVKDQPSSRRPARQMKLF